MKIAICDDDSLCSEQVITAANKYIAASGKDISVSAFSQCEDLLDASCKTGGYDVYILDIVMLL